MGRRNRSCLNKSGISGVITTVLLIGLAVVVIGIVWAVVMNLVSDTTDSATSCFGNFNKIEINEIYTCFEGGATPTVDTDDKLEFSITVGDINLEKIIVMISGNGKTQTIELTNETATIDNLLTYNKVPAQRGTSIPGIKKNSGQTYVLDLNAVGMAGSAPDVIKISPVISGTQCETADTVVNVEPCEAVAP